MTDPYKVLGVSQNASDEELKTAYRMLAKKYHPDSYVDNPLADLASEKMQEINQAYDKIMDMRRGGGQNQVWEDPGDSQFSDIRRLIKLNRVTEAEELLDGVPEKMRDGEWFFLKGTIQHSRGWLDEAYTNFERACAMNPQNSEYQAARNQLAWQRKTGNQNYGTSRRQYSGPCGSGCSICDVCAAFYCFNCCCDCFGGGC